MQLSLEEKCRMELFLKILKRRLETLQSLCVREKQWSIKVNFARPTRQISNRPDLFYKSQGLWVFCYSFCKKVTWLSLIDLYYSSNYTKISKTWLEKFSISKVSQLFTSRDLHICVFWAHPYSYLVSIDTRNNSPFVSKWNWY